MVYPIPTPPHKTSHVVRQDSVIGTYENQPYHDVTTYQVRESWKVTGDTFGTHDHREPTRWFADSGHVEETPRVARRRYVSPNGYVNIDVVDTHYFSRGAQDPYAWSPSSSIDALFGNAVDYADNKALLKLAKARDGVQAELGASLAEARTTLDMLAGVGLPMFRAMLALRKGNLSLALAQIGLKKKNIHPATAANKWLEYQYGWKPLLSDIKSVYDLVHDKVAEPMLIKVKASHTVSKTTSDDQDLYRLETGRAGIGLRAKFLPSGLEDIRAAGLANPLSIVWEIVPFSFVFDWFIPIGNTLKALTATADLQFIDGYRSSKRTDLYRRYYNAGSNQSLIQRGVYTVRRERYNRIPLNGFPTPKVYADETPFSTPRVLNASALITQFLTGR